MTLEQLRIFVAVAELQHVTRAAERLHLTQSSVSSAISTIEERHQVKLFNRVGRRIELTAEGTHFLDSARAVLAEMRSAEATLDDLSHVRRGTLSIFASQTIASFWLPPLLVGYRAKFPNINLKVAIGNTAECTSAVSEGHAELGFIEGEIDLPALYMSAVARDKLVVVVCRDHWWAKAPPKTLAQLLQTDWALREPGSGTRSSFEGALHAKGVEPRDLNVVLELPSNEALCTAVGVSNLATAVSVSAACAGIESGRLVALPLDIGQRAYRLIRHKERRLSRSAQAFLNTLPEG
ncbi:LysR family transcriptional regulator [Aquamicrobium zhengzhouense]|uniref:LysR family transcriptional regulator n=1 Tax=Aquamicrobium zhengzhouense TaxID=2781738 RepID=A0ABS0SEK5_9HYPH|nr:LysR family transcriptional regulator [Aquamicrobium zhengzhouense]MBI1621661.1 LysR family transcriptional regulator [Aquamicrobium zhengzhouense]